MPYRKVGVLESIWYVVFLSVKEWLHNFKHLPVIKEVWVDGVKNTGWKYNHFTGELKFKQPIHKGAVMVVISRERKPRKRGKKDDGSGTEQTVLHTKAD